MSEHKEKLLALMRQLAIPLFVGGLFGFLIAMLIEWGMINVLFNVAGSFYIVTMLLFIFVFILLGVSLYLLYNGHALAGALCMVAGFKLLDWILQWYLPIMLDGYWGTMEWWFEFPF
jgi:hypothetical protein